MHSHFPPPRQPREVHPRGPGGTYPEPGSGCTSHPPLILWSYPGSPASPADTSWPRVPAARHAVLSGSVSLHLLPAACF